VRVTGAARGWVPADAFAASGDDTEQQRALLARIAAAAAADGAPEARTDADLMYDALKQQWHGQLPGSATIDKVVAQSKTEADRSRRATRDKIRTLFWKDPFSEEPQKLIPVRREDRDLLAAHPTTIATRARADRGDGGEAARLRAEVSHLRSELARAEAERTECVAESGASEGIHLARRHLVGGHVHRVADRVEALNSDAPRPERRHTSRSSLLATTTTTTAPAAAAPPPPSPIDRTVSLPPPGWRSSDPRGIIVVPIAEPIPVQADSKPRRHAGR
jgi:hypothetical protein